MFQAPHQINTESYDSRVAERNSLHRLVNMDYNVTIQARERGTNESNGPDFRQILGSSSSNPIFLSPILPSCITRGRVEGQTKSMDNISSKIWDLSKRFLRFS